MRKLILLSLGWVFVFNNVDAADLMCPGATAMAATPGAIEAQAAKDEAILPTVISLGTTLQASCVPPPADPARAAWCASVFTSYSTSVASMLSPCPMVLTKNPYFLAEPFSPCKYTASSIYLPQFCQLSI